MDEKDKDINNKDKDSSIIETSIVKDETISETRTPIEKESDTKASQPSIVTQKQDGKLLFFEIATVILLIILTVFITRDIMASHSLFNTCNGMINISYPHRF